MHSVLQNLPLPAFEVSTDGGIRSANGACRKLLGRTVRELESQALWTLLSVDEEQLRAVLGRAGAEPVILACVLADRAGNPLQGDLILQHIARESPGEAPTWVAILSNVRQADPASPGSGTSACEKPALAGADEDLRFTDLFDMTLIQEIQDAFALATGVASVITDPAGVPYTVPSNFCRLCRDVIRKTPLGLRNCMKSDAILGQVNSSGPRMQPCLSGGLWDGGASISVGRRHIANWLIGQVRDENLDETAILRYSREIGADEDEFRSALAEVTRMPVAQFANVCKALFLIANQLSQLAYSNAMQAKLMAARLQAEEEKLELEDRLRQSEKMRAVGQLAGGIAHDFNNQLVAILGYAELITRNDALGAAREHAEKIIVSARRSAELTRKLLAFARKGRYLSMPVDLQRLVREVTALLERSLGKNIVLRQTLSEQPTWTIGDASQIQSAILNLALNARDSMPHGGTLEISTGIVEVDEALANGFPHRMSPGRHVLIQVDDTGTGIEADILPHIFEPFFTTRKAEEGTGMGLASVYGTVLDHKGGIRVETRVGQGSSFRMYLPAAEPPGATPGASLAEPRTGLSASVLVVDDEPAVRGALGGLLEHAGCQVTVCADGSSAVDVYRERSPEFDLVILDMVMPGMSGLETFRALRAINPDAQVIIASGFSLAGEAQQTLHEGAVAFLQKPFEWVELSTQIDRILRGARVP